MLRHRFSLAVLTAVLLFLVSPALPGAAGAEGGRPNVLFIAIDDLNDWANTLGAKPQHDGRKKAMAQWMPETEVPNALLAEGYKKKRNRKK